MCSWYGLILVCLYCSSSSKARAVYVCGMYTLHRIRSPCMAPRAQQGHSTAKHATHIHAAFCRRSASMPSFGTARCDLTYKPWGRARAPLHSTIEVKAFNVCTASWERATLYGSSGMLSSCCTFGECALAVWDDTVTCGTHTHTLTHERFRPTTSQDVLLLRRYALQCLE